MLTLWILACWQSPRFWEREKPERHVPWPVVAWCIKADHPDPEVKLRRQKMVPHWYRTLESDPWILKALAYNGMYQGLWLQNQKYRTRFYILLQHYDVPFLGHCWLQDPWWRPAQLDEITDEWCIKALCYLRGEQYIEKPCY